MILIAGPCVIESREHCLFMAGEIKSVAERAGIEEVYFKASYDKANRTSIKSYRGPGMYEGLKILKEIKNKFGIKVTSDIHDRNEAITVSEVVDLVQIPALLSRQTDLLKAAGCYSTSVNIKKGQFAAPWDIKHAVEKVKEAGCDKIFVTERGTSFGYNRLVVDMASFHIMRESMPDKGVKFIFDATHSCQLPGAGSGCSSGNRDFVPILARAAIAAGADGIFIEVHNDPDKALCDGPNSLALKNLEPLLKNLLYLQQVTTVI